MTGGCVITTLGTQVSSSQRTPLNDRAGKESLHRLHTTCYHALTLRIYVVARFEAAPLILMSLLSLCLNWPNLWLSLSKVHAIREAS